MKTRRGFISNSSTTSFTVYGTRIGSEEALKFIKTMDLTEAHECVNGGGDPVWVLGEALYNEELEGLEVYYGDPNSYSRVYLGGSPDECPDNKTMGDFKEEIEGNIKKTLKTEDVVFGMHSEAYRDG